MDNYSGQEKMNIDEATIKLERDFFEGIYGMWQEIASHFSNSQFEWKKDQMISGE